MTDGFVATDPSDFDEAAKHDGLPWRLRGATLRLLAIAPLAGRFELVKVLRGLCEHFPWSSLSSSSSSPSSSSLPPSLASLVPPPASLGSWSGGPVQAAERWLRRYHYEPVLRCAAMLGAHHGGGGGGTGGKRSVIPAGMELPHLLARSRVRSMQQEEDMNCVLTPSSAAVRAIETLPGATGDGACGAIAWMVLIHAASAAAADTATDWWQPPATTHLVSSRPTSRAAAAVVSELLLAGGLHNWIVCQCD